MFPDQHFLSSQSQSPDGDDINYLAMEVKEEIDFFTETVKKIRGQLSNTSLLAEEDDEVVSSRTGRSQGKKSNIFPSDHDELIQLKNLLMRDPFRSFPKRRVVSIVGMAGIGKTALAQEILEDSDIRSQFKLLAFASVGPKCVLREIMLDLLAKSGVEIDKPHEQSDWQLGDAFYKKLQEEFVLQKRFLNQQESWLLFCDKVFGGDHSSCPSELEKAGRKIVKKCEGLPLTIIAVARHLRDHEKTPEYWKQAAKKVHTAIIGTDKAASKVLYQSYKYLRQYLKPCFLYMGVFPHDSDITASKLINLWCTEGFLQQYGIQTSLEDSAMKSLEKLVSSNVVKVRQRSSSGGIKTCNVYPPFWHICMREAGEHKFFHVIDSIGNPGIESQRRLCIHNNVLFGIKDVRKSMTSTPNMRSLLCTGPHHQYPVPTYLDFSLLRVLDALTIRFYGFPSEVVKLVQLRYLAITYNGMIPDSISKLRTEASRVMGSDMPDPSSEDVLLPNLLTLSGISARSCTKEVIERILNLKRLGIRIEVPVDTAEPFLCFNDLVFLNQLKSLKCSIVNPNLKLQVLGPKPPVPFLPVSLRKLTLSGLGFPWEHMSIIACLPNLEVLKLRCYAFRGPEWETFEGGFLQLRFLLIEDTDLEYWRADSGHFPRLQRLLIHHCYKLKEIPLGIEDITTLKMIEIVDGSPSLVASAKQIQEEQHNWGNNYGLQVCVKSSLEENRKPK
ncbi:UNVERIFIED_CONTAM: Disease resistance protein RPP13 [Sesamum latifolium]|uniref:Disease resistance protein RPP13 n=1 Tax=Sesamum latifolium TaxID=2727402 RepID=A0AAW2UZ79_9LAMI